MPDRQKTLQISKELSKRLWIACGHIQVKYKGISPKEGNRLFTGSPTNGYRNFLFLEAMNLSIVLVICTLLLSPLLSDAQHVTGFINELNHFMVFDNGKLRQLEDHRVISYRNGDNYVAYIDAVNTFKIYFNGATHELYHARPKIYMSTDYMLYYDNGADLKAFRDGEILEVEYLTRDIISTDYKYGDSLIAFIDRNKYLKVYYNGEKRILEQFGINDFKSSDNVIAYIRQGAPFRAFYNGRVWDLHMLAPKYYQVSRNMVAFITDDLEYMIFHKGQIYSLDEYKPQAFNIGNDLLAFATELGDLKVFFDGEIIDLLDNFIPPKYLIRENVLVYSDESNFFHVFYKGKSYQLETFIPDSYQMDNDMLVYKDLDGRLYGFIHGTKTKISRDIVTYFKLVGEVVLFKEGTSEVFIYHKGKIY